MIPVGWSGFLAFVLFVAPGIVYDLRRARTAVPEKESTFREISRVALVSTLCSTPAVFLVLTVLQRIQSAGIDQVPTLQELLTLDLVLVETKLLGTVSVIVGFVAVSMLIAWGLGIRRKSWSRPNLSSTSGWTKALREQLPEGSIPEVTIGTHSGGLWKGRVVHYTADLELENREIVLRPPFEIQLGTEVKHPNPGWSSIVIPAKEISWMAVSYRRIETNTISPAVEPTANLTKD